MVFFANLEEESIWHAKSMFRHLLQ